MCPICGKVLHGKKSLKTHIEAIHQSKSKGCVQTWTVFFYTVNPSYLEIHQAYIIKRWINTHGTFIFLNCEFVVYVLNEASCRAQKRWSRIFHCCCWGGIHSFQNFASFSREVSLLVDSSMVVNLYCRPTISRSYGAPPIYKPLGETHVVVRLVGAFSI